MIGSRRAIAGTASVLTPLMSSTVTTALAFAPIFLLDSVTGLFLHSFVVTIWLCLAASLVAAIAFAAMLLARIGTENEVPGLPTVPEHDERADSVSRRTVHPPASLADSSAAGAGAGGCARAGVGRLLRVAS